jgi:phosphatidylinositol kinase/protein kinase (PI-3  family)
MCACKPAIVELYVCTCMHTYMYTRQSLHDIFGESWEEKKARIRYNSAHGDLPSWDCVGFIVKSGDDLRQEQFAMQLIEQFRSMFVVSMCACARVCTYI